MKRALADRELDIMNILWESGSGTVSEVRGQLKDALAYNTVLTTLRTLDTKGFVRHEEEGKAHRYYPRVAREKVAGLALARLLRKVFQGSPELLITQLVQSGTLSPADRARLRGLLELPSQGENT